MKNSTWKKRAGVYTPAIIHRKNDLVQSMCGKYIEKLELTYDDIFIAEYGYVKWGFLKQHIENKPKSISFRNWVFPVILNKINYNEAIAEKVYQQVKEVYNINYTNVNIEISCKLQHLSLCFDSKHFSSCGKTDGSFFMSAQDKIVKPDVFCVFVRDKSGKIISRRILRKPYYNNKLFLYGIYGDDKYDNVMRRLIKTIGDNNNYIVINRGSFL